MKLFEFFCVTLLFVSLAGAQDAPPKKEEPPEPPYIRNGPASIQWTITYTPKTPFKEAKTAEEVGFEKTRILYSPRRISTQVMKLMGLMEVRSTFEAGLSTVGWSNGKFLVQTPLHPGFPTSITYLTKSDFPELEWVDSTSFKQTVLSKGRKLHLYQSGGEKGSAVTKAYIDADSRLPMLLDDGTYLRTYRFSAPPAKLDPPEPDIQRMFDDDRVKTRIR